MAAEKASSRADTFVKLALFLFISLLSFLVGIFVGKQVSDSDHRRIALESEQHAGREVASTAEGHAEDGDKISEKEVENLTEEFVNKEKASGESEHHEASAEAPTEKEGESAGYKSYSRGGTKTAAGATTSHAAVASHDSHEITEHQTAAHAHDAAPEADAHKKADAQKPSAHAAVSPAAEKVAHGQAPTDGMKEERKPAAVLPSVAKAAVGRFTLQVGSHLEEKDAKSQAAELKNKGFNAFYFPANIQGRTWYRVSVGLFDNLKSANEFRAQFMKESGTQNAIVQKIIQ